MTDLIARSDSEQLAEAQTTPLDGSGPDVQWAPAEPKKKKRRLGLWIGIPVGVALLGAAAASLFLVAPGTSIGGVHVGFLTPGAAADAVRAHVDGTVVTVGDGGPPLTGSELGATVDADALAAAAFDQRPLWNVTQWFGEPIDATVTLDETVATSALREAAPELHVDPTPAVVAFDGNAYAVSPAADGEGISLEAVAGPLQRALAAGESSVTIDATPSVVSSPSTTELAQQTADALNGMLAQIGFYVGDERAVPVDAATAADWITVTTGDDGAFEITADAAKVQAVVDTLKEKIDRAPEDGYVIVNSAGTVLDDTEAGHDGWTLGDTSGLADDFVAQLASGNAAYRLPVEVTPAVLETLERRIEVDLSAQRVYLFENGSVVDSWSVSTGRPGPAHTETGNFTINYHVRAQTMTGCAMENPNCTEAERYVRDNVEWVMYFNGDQAFHGVWWNSDYASGRPTSNGCVGMSNDRARQLYMFAATGTEISIYGSTPS